VTHAMLFLLLAVDAISPEGTQHMQAGVEAHRQGRTDAAIAEFRKATESDPNFPQAFLNLGEEYAVSGNYSAALPVLKRALELDHNREETQQQLGFALLSAGYAADAIPFLERVHAVEALGIAQEEAGLYARAIVTLSAALADRPGDPDLLYYLGRASGLLSKQTMDSLLAIYPDSARAHQATAENYFVLRQMQQAENEYREALRQRKDARGLHLELGLVYAGAGQWPKAEEEFRAETRLQPGNAEASYRLGSALLQEGKAHEAHLELDRANGLKTDMPETLYALGKAASADGDPAGAEKAWLHLLEVEKDTPLAAQAHFGLAGIYRKQGKAERASEEMTEFRKLQKSQ
jgi:tetratricopeptide (TPR) repeat protein